MKENKKMKYMKESIKNQEKIRRNTCNEIIKRKKRKTPEVSIKESIKGNLKEDEKRKEK